MQKVSQKYILDIAIKTTIDREELLIKKIDQYRPDLKDKDLNDMIRQFKKVSQEHIKLMKEKMIKLNVQG